MHNGVDYDIIWEQSKLDFHQQIDIFDSKKWMDQKDKIK